MQDVPNAVPNQHLAAVRPHWQQLKALRGGIGVAPSARQQCFVVDGSDIDTLAILLLHQTVEISYVDCQSKRLQAVCRRQPVRNLRLTE